MKTANEWEQIGAEMVATGSAGDGWSTFGRKFVALVQIDAMAEGRRKGLEEAAKACEGE
jgi:hypothetical protein